MLKTGIHRLDQLDRSTLTGFFGRRRFIAVTLYPQVAASDRADRSLLLEHILLRFATASGTYKRTERHRFDPFDARVAMTVSERHGQRGRCSVHDLAVSDGRTSVDLFERLVAIDGIRLDFLASDATPDVLSIQDPRRPLVVVIDPQSHDPLQVIRPPFVFNVERPESAVLYPVNRFVLTMLLRTEVPAILRRLASGDRRLTVTSVRLLDPECLELLEGDPRFRFERHDILGPMNERFHVVRAMNILNRSYFSDPQLGIAMVHIWDGLEPGGLLVTGSNQGAGTDVDGGAYERTDDGFRRLWVSGTGSPIDDLVLDGPRRWRSP